MKEKEKQEFIVQDHQYNKAAKVKVYPPLTTGKKVDKQGTCDLCYVEIQQSCVTEASSFGRRNCIIASDVKLVKNRYYDRS